MSAGFHTLKILDVRRETDDAISVTLEPAADARGEFDFTPGQHLTLRADIGGEDIRRNYSICVPPGGDLKIGIKRLPGGAFSSWAMDALKPGGTLEAMPPRGHFTWQFDPAIARTYLCFAAGSGITPILSLIETGLTIEPQSQFTLLYGNRTSNSIMFLEELAALKDRYLGRLQVYHFLTAEADDVELFNGRLDARRIAETLSSLVDPKAVDVAFICGPTAMMDAAESAMLEAGVPQGQVLVERFTADRPDAAQEQAERAAAERAEGLRMQITIDGRRRLVEFHADKGSILESAREAGLAAPFACKAGVCATCRAKLVAGEVRMKTNYGLSADEVAQGYVLTCQAVPLGEGVMLDYDA
ncbi:2Fe-2S iron-sulfur cluster-binding protein [Sphingomonas crocodyli]|uniref:2Fe-2S iron-sulfur cluster binding domain-containing protein n=1 Tax=Sphingomonas crocodyli TaxID=1979270 RepID=A0A437M740_9SPHN|nr:2Fe-2S iron-sulfur cluster-binding protein [Sphingomonas crocodyli]RVT93541.1 2Fe-2S iron-sulfur cluster binding domain-containing protein [Sphingomonas crocodyli]